MGLWFDVEKKNYTTGFIPFVRELKLWFDVEKKNYTTILCLSVILIRLWFDVEKKNYTTKQPPTVIATQVSDLEYFDEK